MLLLALAPILSMRVRRADMSHYIWPILDLSLIVLAAFALGFGTLALRLAVKLDMDGGFAWKLKALIVLTTVLILLLGQMTFTDMHDLYKEGR